MLFFQFLSKVFYEMDIFKVPVYFFVNSRQKNSTKFGSFLSCCIYGFIIYSFLVSNMYLRINPAVIDQISQQHHRNALYFDNTNFSLAMSLNNEDGINFIDPTLFTFHLRLRTLKTFEGVQGYQEIDFDEKGFHPCSPSDFPGNPTMFHDLALTNALCLDNSSLKLEGYWDESRLTYIKIWLNMCINQTNSSIVCKSENEINEFLKGKYFGIYYQDFSFDLKNYSTPVKKNFKYDYQLVTPKMRKEVSIFIRETEILNDDNYFFNDDQTVQFYQKDFLTLDFEELKEDKMLNTILIYASNNKQSSTRKYQKFAELLASLGGTAKALMMFGFLLVKNQATLNLMRLIMSKLYDIPIIPTKLVPRKNGDLSLTKTKRSKIFKKSFARINVPCDSRTLTFANHTPMSNSQEIRNSYKHLFSLWRSILTMFKHFFRCKRISKKERLFIRTHELYSKTLDVCVILNKIQEIDKLKAILLSPHQKSMFNLMSKPILSDRKSRISFPNQEKHSKGGEILSKMINGDPEEDKLRVQNYFKQVSDQKDLSEIDRRLFELVEKKYAFY